MSGYDRFEDQPVSVPGLSGTILNVAESTCHAVILAAGAGTRLGGIAKGRLFRGDRSLLGLAVERCLSAGIAAPVVVLGADLEAMLALPDLPQEARLLAHATWAAGRTSSLKAGLRALGPLSPRTPILLFPVEYACIGPTVIPALLSAYASAADHVAGRWVPVCDERRGHPILFTASLIPTLMDLDPEDSLRPVFQQVPLIEVTVKDPGVLQDVNTPEDARTLGLSLSQDDSTLANP